MKPVYEALDLLLTHKGSASYAEIASVAGKKKADTLRVLNANSKYFKIGKGGRIIGWAFWAEPLLSTAYQAGKIYIEGVYYGNVETWVCKRLLADKLAEPNRYDGTYVIMRTPENEGELRKMGLLTKKEYLASLGTTEENWTE